MGCQRQGRGGGKGAALNLDDMGRAISLVLAKGGACLGLDWRGIKDVTSCPSPSQRPLPHQHGIGQNDCGGNSYEFRPWSMQFPSWSGQKPKG